MIIARISSGLGNQFFQYATARSLAIRLGTALHLDTSKFGPHEPRECLLQHFQIAGCMARPFISAIARSSSRVNVASKSLRQRFAGWVADTMFHTIEDRQAGFDRTLSDRRGNLILSGHWETEKYFVEHRELIRKELTLRDAPDPQTCDLLADIQSSNAVAVHIRRGDREQVAALQAFHGLCPASYYQEAAAYLSGIVTNPVFYVFTDGPDWVRQNIHLPGKMRLVTHNLGERDYEDMRLMRACRYFIIANSTFSWWGAWLSDRADKIVIAPKRWFATEHASAADICPHEWIRM